MKQVNIEYVRKLAEQEREGLVRLANAAGHSYVKTYIHWSAGHYETLFDDYHINIKGDGSIWLMANSLQDVLAHTWRRNTGSIGVSLACAYGADTRSLGDEPPTEKQIESLAQVVGALAEGLWQTIDKRYVLTHGEAADNEDGVYAHEPYGPRTTCERWDLEYLETPESPLFNPWATDGTRGGDIIRGKANWYVKQWRNK